MSPTEASAHAHANTAQLLITLLLNALPLARCAIAKHLAVLPTLAVLIALSYTRPTLSAAESVAATDIGGEALAVHQRHAGAYLVGGAAP